MGKEVFYYEIIGEEIVYYYRNKGKVLECIGTSLYEGDPNDIGHIRGTIDDYFRDDMGGHVKPVIDYIAHRFTIDDKFKVES